MNLYFIDCEIIRIAKNNEINWERKQTSLWDHWLSLVLGFTSTCIGSAKPRVAAWHSERGPGEMDDVEKSRLPGASQTKWNFHSCTVSSLYDHTQPISRFQTILDRRIWQKKDADRFLPLLDKEWHFPFTRVMQSFHMVMNCEADTQSAVCPGLVHTFHMVLQEISQLRCKIIQKELSGNIHVSIQKKYPG